VDVDSGPYLPTQEGRKAELAWKAEFAWEAELAWTTVLPISQHH